MEIIKFIRTSLTATALSVPLLVGVAKPSSAQSEPILGQLMTVGLDFCPRGWAKAEGQLIAISLNPALYSVLGTRFGGDGRTTFGLPDLRGRSVIGVGIGPGMMPVQIGQAGGSERKTLSVQEMPSHSHMVAANNGENGFADRLGPGNDFMGSPDVNDPENPAPDIRIYSDQAPNVLMDSRMITNTGGNQSFGLRDPYLGMITCIALEGIFPSRP